MCSINFSSFLIWVNMDGVDHFIAYLVTLQGNNLDLEHLRLPLQVALLISPIFLLQEAQIHLSPFYVQRYKLALVCAFFLPSIEVIYHYYQVFKRAGKYTAICYPSNRVGDLARASRHCGPWNHNSAGSRRRDSTSHRRDW